jgi:hypothetical protein
MRFHQRIRSLTVTVPDRLDNRAVILTRGLAEVVRGLERQPDVRL